MTLGAWIPKKVELQNKYHVLQIEVDGEEDEEETGDWGDQGGRRERRGQGGGGQWIGDERVTEEEEMKY